MKNISSKYLKKKRVNLSSLPDELEEDDWISAITTPSKPRAKRVLESIVFRARDRVLRDLVNSRLLEEPMKADSSIDDTAELDHHLDDQTLDSPLPRTPPRRPGYPLESFAICDNSPFLSSRYPYSSPTVTLALIRKDIPRIPTPTSVDNWLSEPYGTHNGQDVKVKNAKRKGRRLEATGFLFGLELASTYSSYSISSAEAVVGGEEEIGKVGEDRAESQLDSSPSVGSCPGASTSTPTLA